MSEPAMEQYARFFAARGWAVFPLHTPLTFGPKRGEAAARCSCGSEECESQGKHPRTTNGLDDATTDLGVISTWWTRWPRANVGLATGRAFDAIDLDGVHGLAALDAANPTAPPIVGPMVCTGRDSGIQIYVQPSGAGNRAAMLPHVDYRGIGGYVVAAGSMHHLGRRYEWASIFGPDTDLEPLPVWLDDIVHKRTIRSLPSDLILAPTPKGTYGAKALEGEIGRLALAREGTRNDELNRSAFRLGQLVAGGELAVDEVVLALSTVAVRIGLGTDEATATIRSGMENGMAHPRRAVA